jgi:hypothetical protein
MPLVGKLTYVKAFGGGLGIVRTWRSATDSDLPGMGSYIFERTQQELGGGASLAADVERALAEFDWVESFSLRVDDGDGAVVLADVHFDPDWPDTANPDLVAETLARFGLRILEDHKAQGRVQAADPLRASASVDEGGIDLFVFDEE